MMKKKYKTPAIHAIALHTGPFMNLDSYRQAPVNGDTQKTNDDSEFWGY